MEQLSGEIGQATYKVLVSARAKRLKVATLKTVRSCMMDVVETIVIRYQELEKSTNDFVCQKGSEAEIAKAQWSTENQIQKKDHKK